MTEQLIDFMLQYYEEIQALAGIILFSATTHFSYQIVHNLERKEDYALARFFLKRKTSRSFWVISMSALILSFGMALKNIGTITGNENYIAIALLTHVLMLFGLAYFTFNIYLITSPGLDHATGKQSVEEEEESKEGDVEDDS